MDGVIERKPFRALTSTVGAMVKIGVEKGRSTNAKLKGVPANTAAT